MSSFTIEKSPKREELNKGNNIENQYDQLARNPLGESKVHNEIKHEMVNQSLSKTPRIDTGMGFLRKEKSVNPLEENLKERDNYVVRGTFGRNIDKIVAKGQASLVLAGYDLGEYGYKGVDGVKGELTKKAVIEFQTAVGLKPTGEFDQDTMKALDLVTATKLTKAEIEAIGKKVMQGQEIEKPALKQPEIKPLSPKELTPEAKKRLAERDEKIGKIGSKGNYQYAQVEASLEMMGYKNNKPIDGQPDRQTFENIKQFQKDTGLPVTGKLDPDTYYMLERKTAEGWKRTEQFKLEHGVYISKGQLEQLFKESGHVLANKITDEMVNSLNRALDKYNITNPKEIKLFITVCLHESKLSLTEAGWCSKNYVKEYCKMYEPGTAKGKELGNIQVGDGYLFRGGGFIQITGRTNYQAFADSIGDPEIMKKGADYVAQKYPWEAAAFWWKENKISNIIAKGSNQDDLTTFKQVSNAVNKGPAKAYVKGFPNNWEDRVDKFKIVNKIIKD